MLKWTKKQREYLKNANHRWNFKVGAVRSGKTFQDKEDTIPRRIRERSGKDGLCVIIGVTEATIERNVLRPMRDKFGSDLVGNISKNVVWLFGEECYALGAEKVNQVAKIQGASFKYVYGDEVAKWNKEVFDMVKSRLDQDYSLFDGTCNPEQKKHWLKKFLDSDADIYMQHYTIDDNEFLSPVFKENLKKEYRGTVKYDRYIKGLWVNAEGIIYRLIADNPQKFGIEYKAELKNGKWHDNLPKGDTVIGIDYGGTKSGQAFVAVRISGDYRKVIALASKRIEKEMTAKQLEDAQFKFIDYVSKKFHCNVDYVYPDNEETVHINSIRNRCYEEGLDTIVRGCIKEPVNDRIDCQNIMLSYDIFSYITGECGSLIEAMTEALWSDKPTEDNKDERLDDFTTDIDSMDAYEYTIERYIKRILNAIKRGE